MAKIHKTTQWHVLACSVAHLNARSITRFLFASIQMIPKESIIVIGLDLIMIKNMFFIINQKIVILVLAKIIINTVLYGLTILEYNSHLMEKLFYKLNKVEIKIHLILGNI